MGNPYNGFTWAERMAADRIQKAAHRAGRLVWPTRCSMCGNESTEPGVIVAHLEDYTRPLDAILPCCIECHMRLHARYRFPGLWRRHLLRLRAGWRPRLYRSHASYMGANRGEYFGPDDAALAAYRFVPDPAKWWEGLSTNRADTPPREPQQPDAHA